MASTEARATANLKRQTTRTANQMMKAIRKAIAEVDALIAENVKQNPYGWLDAGRENAYRAIDAHFKTLRRALDNTLGQLALSAAKRGNKAAIEQSKGAITAFDEEHLREYLTRITPKAGPSLAAVYTASISASAKAALRETAVSVFTTGAASGMTMNEQARQFQQEWALRSKDNNPYRFVDKAGRAWENARYVQMLTRTTAQRVETAAFCDSMLSDGFPVARISNDSDHDCGVCSEWEGRLIDLSPGHQLGAGTWTLQEAREAGVFHPNCTHRLEYVSVLEIPDTIFAKIKDKIGKPGAFGDNKAATKPDLQTNAQRKKHVQQVEDAAEEKAKETRQKTYIGEQKDLTDATALNVAAENKRRLSQELARGTMPRKDEYAAWVDLLSDRDAAWLSRAKYRKARGGAYYNGRDEIHVDGAERDAEKVRNGSRFTFFHETGHAILGGIAQKDPRVFSKIRDAMDRRETEIIEKIERQLNFRLLRNVKSNMVTNYGAFGWKRSPERATVKELREFYDDNEKTIGRADAACAILHGERSSGHERSYWGAGNINMYKTSHEFVANLTAARYNGDKGFFELFNPLAQEVQDLLDSYEP